MPPPPCPGTSVTHLRCPVPTRSSLCARPPPRSINEKGLYDYLLINDDLEEAMKRLTAIAGRAAVGLGPEPGMVPERVVLEDVSGARVAWGWMGPGWSWAGTELGSIGARIRELEARTRRRGRRMQGSDKGAQREDVW